MKQNRSFFQTLFLCLRSKCPVCTQGYLFVPLLKVSQVRDFFIPPEHCPQCHFHFARGAGYYFGVLTPTLGFLSLASGIGTAGLSYFIFQSDISDVMISGGIGILAGMLLFFRTSIAVFMAFDHALDPPDLTT